MVVMRTNDNVFVLEALVFARNDGNDVMGSPLLRLPVCKVMVEALILLFLDHSFEFQLT